MLQKIFFRLPLFMRPPKLFPLDIKHSMPYVFFKIVEGCRWATVLPHHCAYGFVYGGSMSCVQRLKPPGFGRQFLRTAWPDLEIPAPQDSGRSEPH
jgi:hypothetical protein